MPWTDLALIIGGALLGTFGHFLFIIAFQRAPASALTPFTYVHLIWATLIRWVVFGTLPDAWTLAGMAVIGSSGLLIALHERRRAKGVRRNHHRRLNACAHGGAIQAISAAGHLQ